MTFTHSLFKNFIYTDPKQNQSGNTEITGRNSFTHFNDAQLLLCRISQISFLLNNTCREFHENITNRLIADTRLKREGRNMQLRN